jgi:hypothetical protein
MLCIAVYLNRVSLENLGFAPQSTLFPIVHRTACAQTYLCGVICSRPEAFDFRKTSSPLGRQVNTNYIMGSPVLIHIKHLGLLFSGQSYYGTMVEENATVG